MKREDKYPETSVFVFSNVNPKKRITGDCRIRGIVGATGKGYNDVVMDLARIQCETGYDQTASQGISILMEEYDWVKQKQPRKKDNTKYTGKEFCKLLTKTFPDGELKSVFLNIGGHHEVCVKCKDGKYKVHDIWDSTDGCVGNFWIDGKTELGVVNKLMGSFGK